MSGYFDHQCSLQQEVDQTTIELPPYTSKYRRWMFNFVRKVITVDEESTKAKRFFRSYASLRAEKKKHMTGKYFRIIHPFSKFAMYKDRVICVLWMTSLLIDPVRISFFMICGNRHILHEIQWTLDGIFLLNVVITCFVGYCNKLTKEIVVSPKMIIKRKLFSYLIPETLACLPIKEIAVAVTGSDLMTTRISGWNVFRCFRIMRLFDMIRSFSEILQDMRIPVATSTLVIVFLMAFYLIHWFGCILYYTSIIYFTWKGMPIESWLYDHTATLQIVHEIKCSGLNENFFSLYILVLIRTTSHFFGAGDGYRPLILDIEKIGCAIVTIIGFCYFIYSMAKVLELFGSVNKKESKYEELIHQVSEYVRSKNISESLKKRLITYYEYKFQKKFFEEEDILSSLTDHLRSEITLYTCKTVIEKISLFYGMSRGAVGSILGFMNREIYLPNDVVLKYGDPLLKMVWVAHGTLAVYYGPESVEILHFEDGDHFADLAISKRGMLAKLSVVALEISEVFTLARKDILHCTSFLKEMGEKVSKSSGEKYNLYHKLYMTMKNEGSKNMVLGDLNRGRILEKDRVRKGGRSMYMRS